MDTSTFEKRFKDLEARVDALEGKKPKAEATRAPASPATFKKADENEFPKWVYAFIDGEVKSRLVKTADDMPEGAAESPADVVVPSEAVEIPADWQTGKAAEIKALAAALTGEAYSKVDDAKAAITLELEKRDDA